MGGFNRADGHGTQGGKDVFVEGEAVEPGSGRLAVDLHVGAHESLGEVGHGGVGSGWAGAGTGSSPRLMRSMMAAACLRASSAVIVPCCPMVTRCEPLGPRHWTT